MVRALILTGYGINCDEETVHAFKKAGADARVVHVNDLISGKVKLDDFRIMAFPGGFSYGDDTGSGNALANRIRNNMWDMLARFVEEDNLVLGICNGFQVLMNLGLLPAIDGSYGTPQAALDHNRTARYECRWVSLKVQSSKSPFLSGIDDLRMPVAHGEGRFVCPDSTLRKLSDGGQVALRYTNADGSPADGRFPANPNGSLDDIAAITDPTGRVLGMMPHPERAVHFTNLDDWPLRKERLRREGKTVPEHGPGLAFFTNAVRYFK